MQLLAPDILEDARQLSLPVSGIGVGVGLLLWLLGSRTHRFWVVLALTLGAGLAGLAYGRDYGLQPLVAGLLLAVTAGALALALVRLLLFAAGGLACLAVARAVAPEWMAELPCFLAGGLAGIFLYRLWIMALSSFVGTLLIGYGGLALLDKLGLVDSLAWARQNGALLNWGVVGCTVLGVLAQYLVDRRQKRRKAAAKARKAKAAEEARAKAAAPPPPPPPPKQAWWKLGRRDAAQRKAG
jgi:hypothetical protein